MFYKIILIVLISLFSLPVTSKAMPKEFLETESKLMFWDGKHFGFEHTDFLRRDKTGGFKFTCNVCGHRAIGAGVLQVMSTYRNMYLSFNCTNTKCRQNKVPSISVNTIVVLFVKGIAFTILAKVTTKNIYKELSKAKGN